MRTKYRSWIKRLVKTTNQPQRTDQALREIVALNCFDSYCFSLRFIRECLKILDRTHFEGCLLDAAKFIRPPHGLQLGFSSASDSVPAQVEKTDRRLYLKLSSNYFTRLFPERVASHYYVMGLECRSRIEALIHILLHEMVHVFDFVAEELRPLPPQPREPGSHDATFQYLVKRWFGHRTPFHTLIPGMERVSITMDHQHSLFQDGPPSEVLYASSSSSSSSKSGKVKLKPVKLLKYDASRRVVTIADGTTKTTVPLESVCIPRSQRFLISPPYVTPRTNF